MPRSTVLLDKLAEVIVKVNKAWDYSGTSIMWSPLGQHFMAAI